MRSKKAKQKPQQSVTVELASIEEPVAITLIALGGVDVAAAAAAEFVEKLVTACIEEPRLVVETAVGAE